MTKLRLPSLPESHVTPEPIWQRRREFITASAAALVAGSVGGCAEATPDPVAAADAPSGRVLDGVRKGPYSSDEALTGWRDLTTYNNYYEFGTGKDDPARNARDFQTRPWTVTVAGHAGRTGTFALEDLLAPHALEERIYRMRCVEAWSMVIPWVGIPLRDLIARLEPDSRAKYVAFTTLHARRIAGQWKTKARSRRARYAPRGAPGASSKCREGNPVLSIFTSFGAEGGRTVFALRGRENSSWTGTRLTASALSLTASVWSSR